MWNKNFSRKEADQLIERFLEKRSLYPQEWNDFVDTPQENGIVEAYRRQCHDLDPLVNCPGAADPTAVVQLKEIIEHLRSDMV